MLPRRKLKKSVALASAAFLLAAMLVGDAVALDENRPATPPSCAADGTCRPKRESWGHFHTRWRPWPGEPAPQQITPDAALPSDIEQLPPFQRPEATQEDLRGPAKPPKAKPQSEEEENDQPPQALPDAEVLPELDPFGPQGGLPAPPTRDDTPPVLPASLRQISRRHRGALPQPPQFSRPKRAVVQANLEKRAPIRLINPAAAIVDRSAAALRTANYVEIDGVPAREVHADFTAE